MYIAESAGIVGQVFKHIEHPYDIKQPGEGCLPQIGLKKSATGALPGMPEAFRPHIHADNRGIRASLGEKSQHVSGAAPHLESVALVSPPRRSLPHHFKQQFIAADKPEMPVFHQRKLIKKDRIIPPGSA